jgi:hypothetical protein
VDTIPGVFQWASKPISHLLQNAGKKDALFGSTMKIGVQKSAGSCKRSQKWDSRWKFFLGWLVKKVWQSACRLSMLPGFGGRAIVDGTG